MAGKRAIQLLAAVAEARLAVRRIRKRLVALGIRLSLLQSVGMRPFPVAA